MINVIYYYGRDLIDQLETYYGGRLETAVEKGFAAENARFYWLFQELQFRVSLLRQVQMFMDTLPLYLPQGKPEDVVAYVTQYVGTWFQEKNIGTLPQNNDGHCVYFTDDNPYWAAISEVLASIESETDFVILPLFHLNLCEYIVRNVRLYLYLRERQFRAIDREKFDEIMLPRFSAGVSHDDRRSQWSFI